jgi:hypothetical protein
VLVLAGVLSAAVAKQIVLFCETYFTNNLFIFEELENTGEVQQCISQVEPRAVVAAAQSKLQEERIATGATASFRGAGMRLRKWAALRGHFNSADSALLRRPRVMRVVSEALLHKRQQQPTEHALLTR